MGNEFQYEAPFNRWGPWLVIASHFGPKTYRITASAQAREVPIEGTIRYAGSRQITTVVFTDAIEIETADTVGKVEVCFRSPHEATVVIGTIRAEV